MLDDKRLQVSRNYRMQYWTLKITLAINQTQSVLNIKHASISNIKPPLVLAVNLTAKNRKSAYHINFSASTHKFWQSNFAFWSLVLFILRFFGQIDLTFGFMFKLYAAKFLMKTSAWELKRAYAIVKCLKFMCASPIQKDRCTSNGSTKSSRVII